MKIKSLCAYKTFNSRAEENITIQITSSGGTIGFGSAPSGASIGKYEVQAYKKNINTTVNSLNKNKKFSGMIFNDFSDLKKLENLKLIKQLGGNPNLAIEYAILNCMAAEKKVPLYKIINPKIKNLKIPIILGNVIGGGAHGAGKSSDIQEILLVGSLEKNANNYYKIKSLLEKKDSGFMGGKTDEGAWTSTLDAKKSLQIARTVVGKSKLGIDLAASELFKNNAYVWKNLSNSKKYLNLNKSEQINLVKNIILDYDLFYIEDPLEENDFQSFAKIKEMFPNKLICGDDLTVTNVERLKIAIKHNSVNAVIVKPNQIGSLIKTKEFFDLAVKNKIVPIISHRSGETNGTELAHIALAWGAPYIKCGIATGERVSKINELIIIGKQNGNF